jgi:hypothetical protein
VTVTVNVHVTDVGTASVAVAVTVVAPTGNVLPFAGTYVTATGATPPDVVAAGNVTVVLVTCWFAGHVIANGGGGGRTVATVKVFDAISGVVH